MVDGRGLTEDEELLAEWDYRLPPLETGWCSE